MGFLRKGSVFDERVHQDRESDVTHVWINTVFGAVAWWSIFHEFQGRKVPAMGCLLEEEGKLKLFE